MSWLSNRDAQNAANYRYIQFEGGRILQAKELSDLQDADALLLKQSQSAVFRDGAVANAKAVISGGSITLTREHTEVPVMMVFVNGSFEVFADRTLSLPTPKVSGTDTLYAHWVLWRVTHDGNYLGTPGCVVDASLIDQITSESVAERGQLQVIFSFDQTLSDEVLDPVRMISKSTTAIPVFQVLWTASVPSVVPQNNFQIYLVGSQDRLGVVKLSTSTSDTAAATNDPRLSDDRIPVAGSVSTLKLSEPELTGGTTDITSPEVETGPSSGGVDVSRLWWGTLRAKLSDVLSFLYTQLGVAIVALGGHESRIAALEGKVAPVLDLSFHVGKPLGRASDGGFTHPPVVHDKTDGYRHYGSGIPLGAGISYAEAPWAYVAYAENGVKVGGISQVGTYVLLNPQHVSVLAGLGSGRGNYDLSNYFSLAQLVGIMAQRMGMY